MLSVFSGTTLNYFLDDKINKADILFPGVACFLVAVILGSLVHSSNASDNKKKLGDLPTGSEDKAEYTSFLVLFFILQKHIHYHETE